MSRNLIKLLSDVVFDVSLMPVNRKYECKCRFFVSVAVQSKLSVIISTPVCSNVNQ